MKYLTVRTPSGPLEVSRVIVGSSSRIASMTDEEVFSVFDRYVEAGGNIIDTARGYAGGRSEELISRWLRERGMKNRILIATKAGNSLDPAVSNLGRLSEKDLREDVDTSLRVLGVDTLDILWLHKDEPTRPAEEIAETAAKLIREGKARTVGVSNWVPERIEAANRYARDKGLPEFAISQILWNAARQNPLPHDSDGGIDELPSMTDARYDWYRKSGVSVFAWSSQAGGLFSKLEKGGEAAIDESLRQRYDMDVALRRYEVIRDLAAKYGTSVAAVALGYVVYNPLPSAAIITSRTVEMLEDSLRVFEQELTPEEIEAIRTAG